MADAAFATSGGLHALAAWTGVLSHALQLYFDLSGYSDMALGLARMFLIDFPLNLACRTGKKSTESRELAPVLASLRGAGSVLLTFVAVLVAQVFFRAAGVGAACSMLGGMVGLHAHSYQASSAYHPTGSSLAMLVVGYVIVWAMPNTQQILARSKPSLALAPSDLRSGPVRSLWQPSALWAVALGVVFFITIVKMQESFDVFVFPVLTASWL